MTRSVRHLTARRNKMSVKKIKQYQVNEAANLALGQVGSAYIDTTDQYTPPSGLKIIMIMMLTDVEFSELTPEDTSLCFGTTAAGPGTNAQTLTSSDTFPSGIIIYGRWNTCTLQTAGDKAIVFIGP